MRPLLVASLLVVAVIPVQAAEPHHAHMVFFTLANDTQENRDALVAACQKYLSDHEGTVYFSAGVINEELDREVNDKEFDVALHIVFASRKHHDVYQTHPRHLKFIEENSKLWTTVRVFDSTVAVPRHKIPVAGRGFAGMVTGKVVEKKDGQAILEITQIDKTWRHSKAESPKSLLDQRLVLVSRDGEPRTTRFINVLEVGETVTVDVGNREADTLTILELTEHQRQRIDK